MNLETKTPALPLWTGTGIHAALEFYYREGKNPAETFTTWADASLREIRTRVALDLEVEQRLYGARQLGIDMLTHYAQWAPANDPKWFVKALVTEIEFSVPILAPTGAYTQGRLVGKVDGIIIDEHGYLWVLEHKSFAQEPPTDFLLLDEQTSTYQYAMQREIAAGKLEKYDIPRTAILRGVLYNGLRKKVPRIPPVVNGGKNVSKDRSIDTTYEVYLETIHANKFNPEDYSEILDILQAKGNSFFKRERLERNETEMRLLEKRLYDEYRDMHDPNVRIYPSPTWDCAYMCDYKALCIAENLGSDVEFLIQQLYQQRPKRGTVYSHPSDPGRRIA